MGRLVALERFVGVALVAVTAGACILQAEGFTGGDGSKVPSEGGAEGTSSSSSGTSGNPTLTGDGGSSGTSGTSGTSGDPDSGTSSAKNLLINGDFELGCAGWNVGFGFLAEVTASKHGGERSCQFCMDTNFEAELNRDVKVDGKKGQTFASEVFVQAADKVETLKTRGYSGMSLQLVTNIDAPSPTGGPPLTGDWQRMTTLTELTADSQNLTIRLKLFQTGNPASQGNVICVFVDDAAVRLVP